MAVGTGATFTSTFIATTAKRGRRGECSRAVPPPRQVRTGHNVQQQQLKEFRSSNQHPLTPAPPPDAVLKGASEAATITTITITSSSSSSSSTKCLAASRPR
ncbi:hypothetical protein PLESTB_001138300 [Pleodorina starrii]|uniref:Uncharacterized protein n=1 Tax=Pleodorina starrii TaxID=330485 RepID=A0A9W6BRF8_9CHLO|nr:hypothetical protein PLESTB_001138300 [Pleodorina starrii]GLC66876.1 hypothetical protein PLESTF_000485800 [Pleodorina starrii]